MNAMKINKCLLSKYYAIHKIPRFRKSRHDCSPTLKGERTIDLRHGILQGPNEDRILEGFQKSGIRNFSSRLPTTSPFRRELQCHDNFCVPICSSNVKITGLGMSCFQSSAFSGIPIPANW